MGSRGAGGAVVEAFFPLGFSALGAAAFGAAFASAFFAAAASLAAFAARRPSSLAGGGASYASRDTPRRRARDARRRKRAATPAMPMRPLKSTHEGNAFGSGKALDVGPERISFELRVQFLGTLTESQ